MARKSRIAIFCLVLVFAWSCGGNNSQQKQTPPPAASGPAAAVATNQYKAEGVVKALNPQGAALEIDHGDVEGLMPAMQMEFPVTDPKLLDGLAVNDRIAFTIENATDGMKVVAIQKK
jgi:Cu/Ag efflux protein CusF